MSKKAQSKQTTNKAIEEGNYENFKKSANPKILARITNQADFDKLVKNFKSTKVIQDKINQAIKDNNYDAFKSAQKEMKSLRDANKPADAPSRPNKKTPTEEEQKTRFDKIVSKYKTDGTLPAGDLNNRKGGFGNGGHNRR